MSTSLAERHRPTTFQSVVGQDEAVAQLAGRVRHHVFTPVIITGRVGSGKTTLAWVFGRALVCKHPDSFGSACGRCSSCKATARGETPYYRMMDCAAGTTASDVQNLVANLRSAAMFGSAVCIMDEVHALSRAGFDALLGVLEPPHPSCTFVLVTVHANDIPWTIRSRCSSVRVKRVPDSGLNSLLRNICDEEKIPFTETALAQLVRFSGGIVRQALGDVDQMRDAGITEAAVSAHYGTEGYLTAMAYLKAVFDGMPFAQQADIIGRWDEDVGRKVDTLLGVLLYILHNHFHKHIRRDAVLDAMPHEQIASLIHSISTSAAARSQEGTILCEGAVAFWTQVGHPSDVVFDGKIVTFYHFIGLKPDGTRKPKGSQAAGPIEGAADRDTVKSGARTRAVSTAVSEDVGGAGYLNWHAGAQIWDALSYMVQEHGRLLNTRVSISVPASRGEAGPYTISRLVQGATELVQQAKLGGRLPFLFARMKETAADGERHHLVAHLAPELRDAFRNWLLNLYYGKAGNRREDGIHLTLRYFTSSTEIGRLRWHHHLCRVMVRGLDPRLFMYEGKASMPLLDMLGVRERMRVPIGVSGRRWAVSSGIGENAQKASRLGGLPALSAFGIAALRRLAEGWELAEHKDRLIWHAELSQRKAAIESLVADETDPSAASAVRLGLREGASERWRDPYDRQRSWTIWPRPEPLKLTLHGP